MQKGSSYAAYVCVHLCVWECVCVRAVGIHTSTQVVCRKASWILGGKSSRGANFHGQLKLFIYHKFTIYMPAPCSIMKTVQTGCRRNGVIQRAEKDWSLVGKEKPGFKVQPVSWTQIIFTAQPPALYLSNLDKKNMQSCVFENFVFFFPSCFLPLCCQWWYTNCFPERGR